MVISVNKPSIDIRVFFAHAFAPKPPVYTRAQITSVIESACSMAQQDLEQKGLSVQVVPDFFLQNYGENLGAEIEHHLKKCQICVADISDNNPNVFYELGLARALNLDLIVIKSKQVPLDQRVPSDLAGIHLLQYDSVQWIRGQLSERLLHLIEQRLKKTEDNQHDLPLGTWHLPGARPSRGTVNIIAGPSELSIPPGLDYDEMEQLGDKDTIMELTDLLARLYPDAHVHRYCSDNVPEPSLSDDLILVGGPGIRREENEEPEENDENNEIAKQFLVHLRIPLEYRKDAVIFKGQKYLVEKKDGRSVRDYGVFARFPNPVNRNRQVIFLQGVYALGVLGAAKAFSRHPDARENHKLVNEHFKPDSSFLALFPVERRAGQVIVPQLRPDQFTAFE